MAMSREQLVKVRKARKEARLWAHENKRWNTMTRDQLESRLMRITRPEKLRNFIKMARLRGEAYLAREAMKKMALYREVAAA